MFLRFTRLLLILLTGVVSVTSCDYFYYEGDGCTECSFTDDGLEIIVVCPDFCGPGRTFTYTQLVSKYEYYADIPLPVFTIVGGFPEDSGCMVQDTWLAFLESKDAYMYNFSTDQPSPGTWSCQEVCPTAAVENDNNSDVVLTVENDINSDVVLTSQVSDTPTTSAARAKASTLCCLFLLVVLNSLLINL